MKYLRQAINIINSNSELADFVGGVSETEIEEAELELGVKFSPSYKEFLLKFGCGNFGPQEFFGLGVPPTGIPSAVWYTKVCRRDQKGFPEYWITVYDSGIEAIYCLDTTSFINNNESPVKVWIPRVEETEQPKEQVAESFGQFFLQKVLAAL